jgi:hypothetical protein
MNDSLRVPFEIKSGNTYSNGAYGRAWGVRQVIEFSLDSESGEETVSFKGIAGTCRRKTGLCTLAEFKNWARYEVALNENSWQRIGYHVEVWPDPADEF